jgi:hypothetical protein
VTEGAEWTAWAGSPELVVHIAKTAERALRERRAVPLDGPPPRDGDVAFTGVALVDRDAEVFSTPTAIATEMTPEMLSKCRDLRLTVRSDDLAAQVRFHCRPPHLARVRMSVSGSAASDPDDVATVAGSIAIAVRRGFRRHFGKVERSQGLVRGHVGRRSLFSYYLEASSPNSQGALFGALFAFVVAIFFPHAELPTITFSLACMMPALLYPFWVRYALPRVELAIDGKTRLQRATTRSLLAFGGLAATALLQLLLLDWPEVV